MYIIYIINVLNVNSLGQVHAFITNRRWPKSDGKMLNNKRNNESIDC